MALASSCAPAPTGDKLPLLNSEQNRALYSLQRYNCITPGAKSTAVARPTGGVYPVARRTATDQKYASS